MLQYSRKGINMELRNKEEVIELVNGISHNFEHNFGECALLHEAVGYKSVIPDKFWEDEEKGGYGLCGLYKAQDSYTQKRHSVHWKQYRGIMPKS